MENLYYLIVVLTILLIKISAILIKVFLFIIHIKLLTSFLGMYLNVPHLLHYNWLITFIGK